MATLQEMLAEFGLDNKPAAQEKTASAKPAASTEVQEVLEQLGLGGEESEETITKEAGQNNKGETDMSLEKIYEDIFGSQAPEAQGQEKVASEGNSEGYENEASGLFGEVVSHYHNAMVASALEKIAGSVEAESDQDDEQPLAHLGNSSQMTNALGKPQDPHLPVNHSASGGAKLEVTTGGATPYSLKAQAQIKAILKRVGKSEAGDVGAYKD